MDGSQVDCKKNVILGVIYRPPNTSIEVFNEKLNEILNQIKREDKICYMIGDYNINLLNSENHTQTGEFVYLMSIYAFIPLIVRPTRITANLATLIENIFTNNLENLNNSLNGVLITDISDHFPIFHINRICHVKELDVFMYKRIYNMNNKQAFMQELQEIDWCELCSASGTQESFDLFHNRLTALHNKHFPKVRIKRRYNNKKPWLTEALRISIKHKNKLYYIYQKVKSVSNELNYKRYKSKLQNILKKAEKAYFHDLLLNHSNDIRKSWDYHKRYYT